MVPHPSNREALAATHEWVGWQVNVYRNGQLARTLVDACFSESEYEAPLAHGGGLIISSPLDSDPWVEQARQTLDGLRGLGLATYATHYRTLWRQLAPARAAPQTFVRPFEQGLLHRPNYISGYLADAERIVTHAPKKLSGLRLSDRDPGESDTQTHDFITTGGRLLTVLSGLDRRGRVRYCLPNQLADLGQRGGRTPGEGIANEIAARLEATDQMTPKRRWLGLLS